MLALQIILLFLVALSLWVVIARVSIHLDTASNTYYLKLWHIIKLSVDPFREKYPFQVKLLFFSFPIKPGGIKKRIPENGENREKPTKKRKYITTKSLNILPAILKSISIDRLKMDIDTGNFPLNAQLMPIAQTLNSGDKEIQINFQNINCFDCRIETRGITVLKNIVITIYNNKKQKSWKTT